MSRRQKFMVDPTYGLAHRDAFPSLWERKGHRTDMVDRDWTEYCQHCRQPLALFEELRDTGDNLKDKNTTVTRKLAELTEGHLQAVLFAWQVERDPEVQREIDELSRRLLKLYANSRIVGFRARRLTPNGGPVVSLTPEQWWAWVANTHLDHHRVCAVARRNGAAPIDLARFQPMVDLHPLSGGLPRLEIFADMPLVGVHRSERAS
jgi:hypothetical protein